MVMTRRKKRKSLVFDLGGGIFDISVLKMGRKVRSQIDEWGYPSEGGDLDESSSGASAMDF